MNIPCRMCEFAQVDKTACFKKWTAYQCVNPISEFYHSLLNVEADGDPVPNSVGITWSGCSKGEKSVK